MAVDVKHGELSFFRGAESLSFLSDHWVLMCLGSPPSLCMRWNPVSSVAIFSSFQYLHPDFTILFSLSAFIFRCIFLRTRCVFVCPPCDQLCCFYRYWNHFAPSLSTGSQTNWRSVCQPSVPQCPHPCRPI